VIITPSKDILIKATNSPNKFNTDWLKLFNVRKVNIEYGRIKKEFVKLSKDQKKFSKEERKKEWGKVRDAYIYYCENYYNGDLDAYLELSEIFGQLEEFQKAVECIEYSQKLQKGNAAHLIRLGYNYARMNSYKEAYENFKKQKKLYEKAHLVKDENKKLVIDVKDKEYPTILLNCATCIIRIVGNKGTRLSDKEREDYIEELGELVLKINRHCAVNDATLVEQSFERLQNNESPITNKDGNIVHSVKGPKGRGGERTRLRSELRLGVLILLNLWDSATKNQIREKFLKNADTTTSVLNELVTDGYISQSKTMDGTMVYSNLQLGMSYAHQFLNVIFQDDILSEDIEFEAVFSRGFADEVLNWVSESEAYQVFIPELLANGEFNKEDTIYFYSNKQKMKEDVPEMKKILKKLEKKGHKERADKLRRSIEAIEKGTYIRSL